MQAVQQHVILSAAKNPDALVADAASARTGWLARLRLHFAALRMTGARVGASLARLPARAVDALLWLYQKLVSPALQVAAPSCGCRFAPTCSHYAREALREHGLLAGLALTARRLAKCGPWHPGGIDPVPPSPRLRRTGPPQKPACTRVRTAA